MTPEEKARIEIDEMLKQAVRMFKTVQNLTSEHH